jgi:hypothetical protein
MKNLKYIIIVIFTVFISTGCLEEQWDIADGGTFSAQLYAPINVPFFYQGTNEVTYDIDIFENEGISVSQITGSKQLFAGGEESVIATLDLSSGQFSQTLNELFADVPINGEVLTEDDLAPGDYWDVSYTMTLSDGTELNVQSSKTTNIPFSCVSAIPTEGTWTGTTTLGAFGVIGTNNTVTVTAIDESGNYAMSDLTGGFYENFNFNLNQPGNINDLCNTITVTSAADAQFSIVTEPEYDGSYDPATETLDVAWWDSGNDIHEVTTHSRN